MKKVNVKLPNAQWGTIKTKYPNSSDLVGYDELTNGSKNFDTTVSGVITKRPGGIYYNATALSSSPKDQWEAIFNDGAHHLVEVNNGILRFSSGGGTFTTVTSGYSSIGNFEFAMADDRIYGANGIDSPQVYDRTTSYGGVSYAAPMTKIMGAQAPTSAPTGAVVAGGSIPVGGHSYKVTFLYYDLEESNGGTATGTITTTAGNQTINLSSIPIGGYGVTARKIYRDDINGVYLLVGTVSNNTATTFSDTASTGTAPIPTNHNTPPTFKYIVSHLDRTWIAGIPGDPFSVYFSEAGLPNVFPAQNVLPCNSSDPITALYVYNDKVWVLNRNSLGSVLGTTSDTFRYSTLPSSIGCVDNRSIQVRTTTGIPTMMWLSSKGFYGTNGSSVQYLSDPIENLVNLNIQQANQVKGQNSQTTQSQFLGGTYSPGIDLTSIPGTITTPNPTRTWDTEAEWEGGSSLVNIATNSGLNNISVPTSLSHSSFDEGSYASTVQISSTLRTPIVSNYTGGDGVVGSSTLNMTIGGFTPTAIAQKINLARGGVITQIRWNPGADGGNGTANFAVYTDSSGNPGTLVGGAPAGSITSTPSVKNVGMGVTVSSGTYWIVCDFRTINPSISGFRTDNGGQPAGQPDGIRAFNPSTLSWGTPTVIGSGAVFGTTYSGFTFVQGGVATSGVWIGPTRDTFSDSAVSATIEHTGVFPADTSSVTTVEASNSADMTASVTQTYSNLNGSSAVSLTNKRYWRVKVNLYTTDDRRTAQIGLPLLKFSTVGVWTSEAIDHTTDITSLVSLPVVSSGTTVLVEIATSSNNITYSAFTAVGSATSLRYSKVRITLTTNASNSLSPIVSSATLNWALSSNLQSSAIDTGNTPAGWDIFQSQFAINGGTATFLMRTAATAPGLAAATYLTVTNGQFPTNAVLQFVQWKVVLTSLADSVPTVDSVTINWFISTTNSIRVASLFYNRSYYLAAAEYNQVTNNVVIVLDGEGNWRLYRGITASTMGFFFNDPYYGSSTEGKFVKFLQSTTDQGTPIEMIVDTKSIEFEDPEHTKVLRKLYLRGINTGAAYRVSFSLDGGNTFHLMLDETTGSTTFQTSSNGLKFYRRFIPNFAIGQPTAAKQIMFRISEATSAVVSLQGLKAEVWVRNGETFENADVM